MAQWQFMPYALKIALRFSLSHGHGKKRNTDLMSLISIITILSIVLSVAVLIIGLSIMNGFAREFKNRILSVIPHGQIEIITPPYLNWQFDVNKIMKTKGVVSIYPYIHFTGLLEKGLTSKAIKVVGIDLLSEKTVSSLPDFISYYVGVEQRQQFKPQPGNNQIILGQGVAKALKVSPGDKLTILTTTTNKKNNHIHEPNRIIVNIIGLLKTNSLLDRQLAIVHLQDAQKYLSYGDGITGFNINVNDIFDANNIVYNAGINIGPHIYVKSWITDYGYMYSDIQMVRGLMYLVMMLVISIACANIISTVLMSVNNKIADIAILKTIGATDIFIRSIFLWHGLITGIVGCFYGVVIGTTISINLTNIIKWIESIINRPILIVDVYFINFLPSELQVYDIICTVLITLTLSLLASWYPAQRATKIAPAKILSGRKI